MRAALVVAVVAALLVVVVAVVSLGLAVLSEQASTIADSCV